MSLSVHNLKEHSPQLKCDKCSKTFMNAKILEDHVTKCKQSESKKLRCIVCKHTTDNEADMNRHYEEKHINNEEITFVESQPKSISVTNQPKPKHQIKCRNGPLCRYLKEDRCTFLHEEAGKESVPRREPQPRREDQQRRSSQPWREGQPRREDRQRRPSQPWREDQPRREDQQRRATHSWREDQPWREVQSRRREAAPRREAHRNTPNNMIKQCRFGSRCDKGVFCSFLHLAKDFLSLPAERRR